MLARVSGVLRADDGAIGTRARVGLVGKLAVRGLLASSLALGLEAVEVVAARLGTLCR